jgi:hypothetical protein
LKKQKLPESKDPKRPLSAYMIFSNSVRPKVKAANPTAGGVLFFYFHHFFYNKIPLLALS